ncbi:MAG TPA: DNA replication and repair protein RecF [Chitinophagaceae bacterium]|nr:DNA replication and repair protein RecF [Chitinophagaceae bacterium]
MLRLNAISLIQFKNYLHRSMQFTERIIGISGPNGVGKTNLLDAIHYLCFTKSYFTRIDANNILHGHQGFRLEADFQVWDRHEKAVCILRETGKKEFSVNDQCYDKFSQHIGRYPCVIIAPDDIQIITGGSEERRRFIDTLLSQVNADYLQSLIEYNKVLQQRNSLLRSLAEKGSRQAPAPRPDIDFSLLSVLNDQLTTPGQIIFEKRRSFLVAFLPVVKQVYNEIAKRLLANDPTENINLFFESELLQASFPELLKANLTRDLVTMRTTGGIHRDDLEFNLNEEPFKNIASQGQRKSLLFALKLGEMEVLKKEKGFAPLLLLDDVFEKLDEERIANLLQRVCIENDGQVFITDTSNDRLEQHLRHLGRPFQLIELN